MTRAKKRLLGVYKLYKVNKLIIKFIRTIVSTRQRTVDESGGEKRILKYMLVRTVQGCYP